MNKLLYYKSYEAHMKVYDEMRELDYKNQIRQLHDVKLARQMEAMGLTQSDINDRLMHIKKNQYLQDINAQAQQQVEQQQKQIDISVRNALNDIITKIEKKNQRPTSINTQQDEEVEGKHSPTQTIASEATTSSPSSHQKILDSIIKTQGSSKQLESAIITAIGGNDSKYYKDYFNKLPDRKQHTLLKFISVNNIDLSKQNEIPKQIK